jgi:hypothetical protein
VDQNPTYVCYQDEEKAGKMSQKLLRYKQLGNLWNNNSKEDLVVMGDGNQVFKKQVPMNMRN